MLTNPNLLLDFAHTRVLDYQHEAEQRRLVELLPTQPGRFIGLFNRLPGSIRIKENLHDRTNRKLLAVR